MATIVHPFQASDRDVIRQKLSDDGIMVYPTETFYAIGCLATSSRAVEKIYSLKQRSKDSPLLVLISSWTMLEQYADTLPPTVHRVLKQYWPGALTAVLKYRGNLAAALNHSGETLGFRMTSSPIARELIETINSPLVGTSANISSGANVAVFEKTRKIFGDDIDLYIDGGETPGGQPSTVLDMTDSNQFRILRQGSLEVDPDRK